ncbi:hypothetical protein E2C01_017305 [Portunus trituberculatus]|uniref:Uncharacterized protein n=1 Tax=Portunus trituberculatus TaxID=210409 RepID=A0A5B7DT01_PORTR|nr:hypothetical protein [Portunus trituberculatus]
MVLNGLRFPRSQVSVLTHLHDAELGWKSSGSGLRGGSVVNVWGEGDLRERVKRGGGKADPLRLQRASVQERGGRQPASEPANQRRQVFPPPSSKPY